MTINVVTLTWNIEDLIQNPATKSTITVTPDSQVVFPVANQIVVAQPRSVTFTGGTGSMTGVVATDNTGMLPVTFNYRITVTDAIDTRFTFIKPFTTPIKFSNGATQDLADLLAPLLH